MKKLLVLSGKGGTGKTTLVSSFIELGQIRAYADCDVDAPNLGLLLKEEAPSLSQPYYGMDKAYIDQKLCTACGACRDHCKFQAIHQVGSSYYVDKLKCEGCGVCQRICQVQAARLEENIAGEIQLYREDKIFSTARLKMGEGNSGLLVTAVKENLEGFATDLAIIDGSPGIGCPVIASMNNVDLVVLVVEPSLSSLSDLKRILATARNFKLRSLLVINKYDLDLENTRAIREFCQEEDLELAGEIPFDREIIRALNNGQTIIGTGSRAEEAIRDIYKNTMEVLKTMEG